MKIIITIISLFLPLASFCQMKGKLAAEIKSARLSIERTAVSEVDSNLVKAIENYWTFNKRYKFRGADETPEGMPKMILAMSSLVEVSKHSAFQTKAAMANKSFNRYLSSSDLGTLSKRVK